MNKVEIHYCYPTSPMAEQLGRAGYYVTVGVDSLVISGPLAFLTIDGAEGFCRNKCLTWEPHKLGGRAAQTEADYQRANGLYGA